MRWIFVILLAGSSWREVVSSSHDCNDPGSVMRDVVTTCLTDLLPEAVKLIPNTEQGISVLRGFEKINGICTNINSRKDRLEEKEPEKLAETIKMCVEGNLSATGCDQTVRDNVTMQFRPQLMPLMLLGKICEKAIEKEGCLDLDVLIPALRQCFTKGNSRNWEILKQTEPNNPNCQKADDIRKCLGPKLNEVSKCGEVVLLLEDTEFKPNPPPPGGPPPGDKSGDLRLNKMLKECGKPELMFQGSGANLCQQTGVYLLIGLIATLIMQ